MGYFRHRVPTRPSDVELKQFLRFHGYLDDSHSIQAAVRRFQRRNSLPATGRLNWPTCHAIRAPRCANPELGISSEEHLSRLKKTAFRSVRMELYGALIDTEIFLEGEAEGFEPVPCRWARRNLTYSFAGNPPTSVQSTAFPAVRSAFAKWAGIGVVAFSETASPQDADIRVLWTFGPTSDPGSLDPFYGPGDKLAVGYYPFPHLDSLAGDLHFDASEQWTTSNAGGVSVYKVALHEIGHCLGLGHCFGIPSLMAPNYSTVTADIQLTDARALAKKYAGVPL